MALTIVTGAGSGMGRDITLSLVAAGRPVLAIGRREHSLRETASLSADPALVSIATGDLSVVSDVESVVETIGDQAVHAIVATAGGQGEFKQPGGSVGAIEGAWSDALGKNLFSAVLLIEAVLPRMEADGRIVLIGSMAGLDGQGGPYATAKAALHGYTRDLARRVGKQRITANAIAPGFVGDTEFFEAGGFGDSAKMVEGIAKQTLVGRVGKPDDITACVEWLLSPRAGWITGQTISVNGGSLLA
ncbi:SDR family oxidoreductase [Xanthomonas euroxanthea]|uniref:SDR family NAD(P)-dependent oxidoreductase n=1 Tax=Xanthomonas euroxanthea TaxID=2259622 RepID=UPI002DD67153|nr:SDR family oxidoreductase [Xanthomonas euroxanthea]